MLINQDSTAINSSAILPVATMCSNCGIEERRLILQVRHRGVFRRLCTSCVLRLHPQCFCPTCFQVYPPPPSNDAVVTCFKCYSLSHSRCVASPPNPYTCPLCLHPNTPIFKLNAKTVDFRAMDMDAARKLVAAAKIAAVSMNKAAVAARAEAERRAKDAAFARKRAKEALEHVTHLMMKEKLRKREVALARPVDMPGFNGVGTNGGYAVKINRTNASTSGNNRNGNVAQLTVLEKPQVAGNGDRDNSNQVLAALNAVELRENEKLGGKDIAPMDVDENWGGQDAGENAGGLVEETLGTQEEEVEDVYSGAVLVHYNSSSNGKELHPDPGSL